MKIRNPELIEEELKLLEKVLADTEFAYVWPVLKQFWAWIKLETNISLSDTFEADKQVILLKNKGYPFMEALEFMLLKLLEKDADKPHIKMFIDALKRPAEERN